MSTYLSSFFFYHGPNTIYQAAPSQSDTSESKPLFENSPTSQHGADKSHIRRGSDLSHDNFSVASSTHRHALVPSGYAIVPQSPQVSHLPRNQLMSFLFSNLIFLASCSVLVTPVIS